MILCIRLCIENAHEWHLPLAVAKADIRGAFENTHPYAILKMLVDRQFNQQDEHAIL